MPAKADFYPCRARKRVYREGDPSALLVSPIAAAELEIEPYLCMTQCSYTSG